MFRVREKVGFGVCGCTGKILVKRVTFSDVPEEAAKLSFAQSPTQMKR